MDLLAPAPGSSVPGAPPALRRRLTPEDGTRSTVPGGDASPSRASTDSKVGPATSTPDSATPRRHERIHGVDGIPSFSSYLPTLGLLCAAAVVWLGTRRRPSASSY